MTQVYDTRRCNLGEGPLWHPELQELFWFDIIGKTLHSKAQSWTFGEHVSAAGWVDEDTLLVASETALFRFDLRTGNRTDICGLDADNPVTRSNDGRADPQGGFWIGTMGKNAEPNAGGIYRYYKGELRKLVSNITISNAICFAPDGETAYYTDTTDGRIMVWALGKDGWPEGEARVLVDLSSEDFGADGAVVDADGNLWNAQWGASRVACYGPDGGFIRAIYLPAKHVTCPAFGGPDLTTLFCTSATQGLAPPVIDNDPVQGQTFQTENVAKGQKEHQVIL
ncbi:SMP-30/gluconolactonase/LRE family protein [Shimia ponticola]|uniref:SMP-30/gluconolactonase/LRE family protein n=1 Tax=Shimia ponticola TaxID=2582893 RepID=UPI0011BE3484|nr:SMP-30/gluconolactonase/LRE family protein [Shimia ponticola]